MTPHDLALLAALRRQSVRYIPQFQHWCPVEDAPINELDPAILHCKCYGSDAFRSAQQSMREYLCNI